MTIGIIAAIPQELHHLRGAIRRDRESEIGGFRFDHGQLDGIEVVVAEAGIGKVNTAMVATMLATRFAADPLIFSGVAAGLDPDLKIGDLVLATRAIQHDAGVIENGRLQPYQAGHIPFFNPTDRLGYDAPPRLMEAARQTLDGFALPPLSSAAGGGGRAPRVFFGTVLTGDQFLNCGTTRERLQGEFGALAYAMEGGALAQVAERFGVGWLEVRALSDLAGREARFDFMAFVDEVAASSFAALVRLLPAIA
jgi:adenosylhomocysteine nucleosidase